MKYELPSIELIVIEENNYLKFGEYLNDMQCDDTANKLSLDDLEYVKKLQQENKQIQERMEYLERSNNRREDIIIEQRQEIIDLEDNWDELKEWVNKHYDYYMNEEDYIGGRLCFTDMKNKMQELEGSDSNEI